MVNINNFVIDRIRRGTMFSTSTSKALWNITQVEEPSLQITVDSVDAVDAIGTKIMTFERGKDAQFTAQNSLFDLNLAAAQFGSEKIVADVGKTIVAPKYEERDITTSQTTIVLEEIPVGTVGAEIQYIYLLNGDQTIGKSFKLGSTANATDFTLNAATKTITLPTSVGNGDRILVMYDFNATSAVEVYNSANDFPRAGRFVMEVIGHDVCDPTLRYFAYIIFPNCKLLSEVDISFTSDGKHPFTLQANQEYCDKDKKLFRIVVPEAEAI